MFQFVQLPLSVFLDRQAREGNKKPTNSTFKIGEALLINQFIHKTVTNFKRYQIVKTFQFKSAAVVNHSKYLIS